MTMLGRKERPLARKHRRERDDRLFVIATEDTYAPKQYFSAFELPRVSIHVIESVDGKQSARHVVARLKAVYEDGKRRGDLLPSDAFWALVDTDHYAQGHHVASFSQALKEAKDAGFKVAVSNPCFELWLLPSRRRRAE